MVDARLRFRHLRTFVEVARQRSIGRAAAVLNVTQPAVSKTIRELEEMLAARLVEKDGRSIRLTRHGAVFLRHAGASLGAIQQGVDTLNGANAGPPVRVGALPTIAARIMPRAIAAFTAERTDSPLKIVTGENVVLLDQLRLGTLDLVVGRLAAAEHMHGLRFDYLYSEQVRFIVRTGHPLLATAHFDFALMRDFTVLMPPAGSVIRPYVERYLLTHGQGAFPHAIETVSDSFGRAFVMDTDAIWVISEGVVARELAGGMLQALPVETQDTRGPVGLTLREDAPPNPSVDILARTVRASVQALGL